jgi:hypothetical protein
MTIAQNRLPAASIRFSERLSTDAWALKQQITMIHFKSSPTAVSFRIQPVTKKQLRHLALTNPDAFRRLIKGARHRELTARHLLLHPETIATAASEDRQALEEYLSDQTWKSLYGHDRRMYYLLRAGVEKYKSAGA